MNSMIRCGAMALVLLPLAGCDGDPPAGTDAGMTGTDAGMMMGTDAGMMMGTDAGPMMGTDAGPMMMIDAGPPDMNAVMRQRVASARIRTETCGCDMAPFASTMECESFGQVAAADTCRDMAFSTHFATAGGFFTCLAPHIETLATCVEGASCDMTAQGACETTYDNATMPCQGLVSMDDAAAYTATLDACLATMVVGTGGMCPDDSGAIGTVGASVFSGSTVGAASDLDAPAGCITVMGGGGSPDHAMRWTAPSAGAFVFDTIGSSFDTVLYVLSGCDGAMSLGCNDDATMTDLRSSVTATLTMGQEVLVVVEGFSDSDAGDYVININAM